MAIITFNLQYLNMICLNCGNSYEGNFCPSCGQKAATKRLKFGEMVNNFLNSFVGGDNVFMNTSRDLVVRPGHMVRNYLLGKRIKYYNPLQMFVFTLTVYAIVSYVLNISSSIFDEMTTFDLDLAGDNKNQVITSFISDSLNKLFSNKLYGTLFSIIFAIPSYHFFFRKCKIERPDGQMLSLSHTEQFYAQMYHSCVIMLISIVLLPLCLIKGSDTALGVFYGVISVYYVVVLYKQMLGIGWLKCIYLNILSMILSIILLSAAFAIIFIAANTIDSVRG